jgi:hypothetical protein
MSKMKNLIYAALTCTFPLFIGHALAESESKYFDFNSQKFISKNEVDSREKALSLCAQQADVKVDKGIRDGTIPIDTYWQNYYHTAFTKDCLNKNH